MADNISPLIPMTQRQLDRMSIEEQHAYWVRVFNAWSPSREHLDHLQREFQSDHRDARQSDDWVGA